ncbi:HAD family hydrolase [Aquimarina hainanensis]|uniref:phosphoglycolate phosphatase n=1 Tax=Aquimarina hainanensis TaxID=1578017 RepID=A0ABW5N4L6_9FLAO
MSHFANTNTLFVFDIDGTLTDSVPMYLMAVTNAMYALGIKEIDTDYNAYKHHSDSYALRFNYERNFEIPYTKEILTLFEKALIEEMKTFSPVTEIKGAGRFIDFLKTAKIPFCFATGSLPKPALLKMKQSGIWCDEAVLATSKTHEARTGFVAEAIEKAKKYYATSGFSKIISVGDGVWDLKTAKEMSLDFVGIGSKNKKELIKLGAQHYFDSIEELQSYFFSD